MSLDERLDPVAARRGRCGTPTWHARSRPARPSSRPRRSGPLIEGSFEGRCHLRRARGARRPRARGTLNHLDGENDRDRRGASTGPTSRATSRRSRETERTTVRGHCSIRAGRSSSTSRGQSTTTGCSLRSTGGSQADTASCAVRIDGRFEAVKSAIGPASGAALPTADRGGERAARPSSSPAWTARCSDFGFPEYAEGNRGGPAGNLHFISEDPGRAAGPRPGFPRRDGARPARPIRRACTSSCHRASIRPIPDAAKSTHDAIDRVEHDR